MHILVTIELKIVSFGKFGCDTVQGAAAQLQKQYEEGTICAGDLIQMASSVTPTFEGVE